MLPTMARNELEVFLLGLCVVSGLTRLLEPEHIPHVPPVITAGWYLLLVVGGSVAVSGLYWRDAVTGALLNRAGLILVGTGAYVQAGLVGHALTGPALLSAAILVLFGVACHSRARTVSRWLRGGRRA